MIHVNRLVLGGKSSYFFSSYEISVLILNEISPFCLDFCEPMYKIFISRPAFIMAQVGMYAYGEFFKVYLSMTCEELICDFSHYLQAGSGDIGKLSSKEQLSTEVVVEVEEN